MYLAGTPWPYGILSSTLETPLRPDEGGQGMACLHINENHLNFTVALFWFFFFNVLSLLFAQ